MKYWVCLLFLFFTAGCTRCSQVFEATPKGPCVDEIESHCAGKVGFFAWQCLADLNKTTPTLLVPECQKKVTQALENFEGFRIRFMDACKKYLENCDTSNFAKVGNHVYRNCIVPKLNEVDPQCKKSFEEYTNQLPEVWRYKK